MEVKWDKLIFLNKKFPYKVIFKCCRMCTPMAAFTASLAYIIQSLRPKESPMSEQELPFRILLQITSCNHNE